MYPALGLWDIQRCRSIAIICSELSISKKSLFFLEIFFVIFHALKKLSPEKYEKRSRKRSSSFFMIYR